MSLQRCQYETPSTDFVGWFHYLQDEAKRKWDPKHNPLFYYLAQIACEIRRGYVKHPGRVALKTFLLDFEMSNEKSKPKKMRTKEQVTAEHKAFFYGALGRPVPGK